MHNSFYKNYKKNIEKFIRNALDEDIGPLDHSVEALLSNNPRKSVRLFTKTDCIIAGVKLAEKIFKYYDPKVKFKKLVEDGDFLKKGSQVFLITGPPRSILSTERIVLNTMQRMSGIASLTHKLKRMIKSFDCVLLDTRKTTPNFRYLEKWAVMIGGGENHRMGLFDAIMIKDNHISFSESIDSVLKKTKVYIDSLDYFLPVIVETKNIKEVKKVINYKWINRILLDNMSQKDIIKALKLIDGKIPTEASGNINEKNIKLIASTGVNYISLGALTHSAPHIDLTLKVD